MYLYMLSLCVYYDLYGSLYVYTTISMALSMCLLWSLYVYYDLYFLIMISMVWINNYFSFSFQLDGPNADKVFKDEDDEEPYPAHWSTTENKNNLFRPLFGVKILYFHVVQFV